MTNECSTPASASQPLDADGALLVTTASGVTRISRPPDSYLLDSYELGSLLPDAAALDAAPF
jgi:hypothetical protein